MHEQYTQAPQRGRFSSRSRARLSAVLQGSGDLVTIGGAAKVLGLDRPAAAKVLARWQRQGWLKRVGRGIYIPVPLDALTAGQVLKDPSVLVPKMTLSPLRPRASTCLRHW